MIGGTINGVRGTGFALVVWNGSVRLEGMAENIETGGGVDGARHGPRVERVANSQGRFERAMSYARFGLFGYKVEDGCAGGFGAGSGGGGNGYEWFQGLGDGKTFAEGGVDEIEEVSVVEDGVQIH